MPCSHFLRHFDSTVNERNLHSMLLDEITVVSIFIAIKVNFCS